MLIVLPPSETKAAPSSGPPLDLATMGSPTLNPTRTRVLDALVALCSGTTERATATLGLGPTQTGLVDHNTRLRDAPTAPAASVYTGVLYERLDVTSLAAPARRRLDTRVATASALFGLVRPGDSIPAYRLSAGVRLPPLGPLTSVWRQALGPVLDELAGELLIDLRSGQYTALHRPAGELARRTVTIRVLTESGGRRTVVSHFNKATKGEIVRDLLVHDVTATNAAGLHAALADLGWRAEIEERRIDVIV